MHAIDFAAPAATLEAVLGVKIKYFPPARAAVYSDGDLLDHLRAALLGEPRSHSNDLIVTAVLPRPYKRVCKDTSQPRPLFASKNYDKFRAGVTISQLRSEGVSKRSINRARAEGWLVVRQAKDRVP